MVPSWQCRDYLLQLVASLREDPSFCNNLRKRYHLAIPDHFASGKPSIVRAQRIKTGLPLLLSTPGEPLAPIQPRIIFLPGRP